MVSVILNLIFRDLVFFYVQMLTAWLPDRPLVFRFRGCLVRPLFKKCGKDFQLGRGVRMLKLERITIGEHVYIAEGCWLGGSAGLNLGDEVMLGPRCLLATANHTFKRGSARYGGSVKAGVRIGRGTWLGAHVVVTPGVEIGSGVAIGANAVVTRNVPDGMIAGGVPARVLRTVEGSSLDADIITGTTDCVKGN